VHEYIYMELIRLKQAEMLAAAEANDLAAAARPKNRLRHGLARLTRRTVPRRSACGETPAHVT
jgi:hypothetical protein